MHPMSSCMIDGSTSSKFVNICYYVCQLAKYYLNSYHYYIITGRMYNDRTMS